MKKYQQGISLIELMIGLLLSLLIMGSVVSVAVATMKTNVSVHALSKIQENSRIAYEFLAREIREAGAMPCGDVSTMSNVLNNSSANNETSTDNKLWADYTAFKGYEGDVEYSDKAFGVNSKDRVANTDAIRITNSGGELYQITKHDTSSARFEITPENEDMDAGDILIACDYEHAAIFQMTGPSAKNNNIVHNTGNETPGNCSKGLGFPTDCTTVGNSYEFKSGFLTKYKPKFWYIGCNGREECDKPIGRSLYYSEQQNSIPVDIEIVDSINDMQVKYGVKGSDSYLDAAAVSNWENIDSLEITLDFVVDMSNANDNQAEQVKRSFTFAIALRNQ